MCWVFAFMATQKNDLEHMARLIRSYGPAGAQAAVAAINEATEKNRQQTADYINQRYELPASYAHRRLEITKYATESNLVSVMQARKRPTKLNEFSHQQQYQQGKTVARKGAGVNIKVMRGGKTHNHKSAFYMKLKNGNAGIVRRKSKARDDIEVLYGPSVASAFRWARDEGDLATRMVKDTEKAFFRYLNKVDL